MDKAEKALRESKTPLGEFLRGKAKGRRDYTSVADRAKGIDSISGKPTKNISVDHVVSIERIVLKKGFDKLPESAQLRIINMAENLRAMDGPANSSKGDFKWSEWPNARKFYSLEQIKRMIELEERIEKLIDAALIEELSKLKVEEAVGY